MIDRIEELLSRMAAEDDEERREEDVPAPTVTEEAVPAFPRRDEGEAGDGETGDRSDGRAAGEIAPERPGLTARGTETERAETIGELWKDGPVWTVRSGSPEMDGAQEAATAERAAQAEEAFQSLRDGDLIWTGLQWTAQGLMPGPAPEGVGRAGLEGLYRQTVRGLRPAAPALPSEQAGRTARTQEPGSAASLAVDELDRAVRRDSRRYDGGMSIY